MTDYDMTEEGQREAREAAWEAREARELSGHEEVVGYISDDLEWPIHTHECVAGGQVGCIPDCMEVRAAYVRYFRP